MCFEIFGWHSWKILMCHWYVLFRCLKVCVCLDVWVRKQRLSLMLYLRDGCFFESVVYLIPTFFGVWCITHRISFRIFFFASGLKLLNISSQLLTHVRLVFCQCWAGSFLEVLLFAWWIFFSGCFEKMAVHFWNIIKWI